MRDARGGGGGLVKGSILESRLAFVRAQIGDEGVARVLCRLGETDRHRLGTIVLPFAWYDFELNERLDSAIAAEMDRGDAVFAELGAASATHNLTSVSQQHYIEEQNPHALLKQASAIYRVYYDSGQREYERVSEFKAILRTRDALSFSAADCLTVVGWHEKAIEMCGGRNVVVRETACRARGDSFCEYVCEWE